MKNKVSNKIIAALVSLIMLVSVIPLNVLAAEISLVNATQLANEALELSDIEYEMTDKRTEDIKVFQRADGTKVMIQSATPLHYLENGQWKEIDNSLIKEEKDGKVKYKNKSNSFDVSFPEEIGEDDYISMEKNGHTIEFAVKLNDKQSIKSLSSAKNNISSKKKEKITDPTEILEAQNLTASVEYKGKKSEPSFKYSVLSEGIKEDIVISEIPTSKVSYSFTVKTKLAVTLEQDKNSENYNSVTFADTNGETVFYIPAPFMYDNNETLSEDISVSLLSDKKNTYTIIYTPNLEWLKSEERVYPVIVDPVITISDKSNIIDTFTSNKFGSAIVPKHGLDYAYVQNDGTLCQTFVALKNDDIEALPANVQILSAKLSMVAKNKSGNNNIINAYKITESWNNLTLINSNKPSYDSTPLSFATITGSSSGRYTWDITEAFAEWLYDESLSNGVMLHTPSSGQVLLDTKEVSDESKRPYFIVEYRESTGVIDDFSYRVQDLGRSGTVYINENTRSFYLEREEIGIGGNNMPVSIKRHFNHWMTYTNDLEDDYLKSCYGTGWSLNYNRLLKYISGTTPQYRYINETGAVIYYVNSGKVENGNAIWIEETYGLLDGTGTKLLVPTNISSAADYTKIKIVSAENQIDHFDSLGRLVKVTNGYTNESQSINIYYSGSSLLQISKITDGVGREYRFTYQSASIVDSLLNKISCYTSNGTQITMNSSTGNGTVPLEITYSYSDLLDGSIAVYNLRETTYPDLYKSTYTYDTFGNIMTIKKDYYVTYNYVYDLSQKVDYVKATDSYTGKTEYLYITQQGPTQTTFTTDSGYKEIRTFDYESGRNSGFIDSENNYIGRNYATMYFNEYILNDIPTGFSMASPENNLLINASFTSSSGGKPTGWSTSQLNSSDVLVSAQITDETVNAMKITGSATAEKSISQTVSLNAQKGDSLVIGGLAKADGALVDGETGSLFCIRVSFTENVNGVNTARVKNISFAPNFNGWQICSDVIDFKGNCSTVKVEFVYSKQVSDALVYGMNLSVQQCGNQNVETTLDNECMCDNCSCECVENCTCAECLYSSSTIINNNNNTDKGTTILGPDADMRTVKSYTTNGNYLKSETDINGRTFTYNVDENNGLVKSTQVGNTITNYTYDAIGAVQEISQVVSALSNGTEMSLDFDYDGYFNIQGIEHNGVYYSTTYDGDKIKVVRVDGTPLVSYSYSSDSTLNSITYNNDDVISYTYSNGRILSIYYNNTLKYSYSYDSNGNLISVTDVDAGWKTSYENNGYTVRSTADNSIIYVSTESENGETDSYFGIDFEKTNLTGEYNSQNATKVSSSKLTTDFGEATFTQKTDYYDRIIEKTADINVDYSDETGVYASDISVVTNTEYKTLDTGYSTMMPEDFEYVLQINQQYNTNKFKYHYDSVGNIVQIDEISSDNTVIPVVKYKYDEANQLIREDNSYFNESYVYTYDVGGNMVSKGIYNFTFGNLGEIIDTITFGYSAGGYEGEWEDQMEYYNDSYVYQDLIGNSLIYYGNSPLNGEVYSGLAWEGQELKQFDNYHYEYDANGYRVKKVEYFTNSEQIATSTEYIWKNGLLTAKRISTPILNKEVIITYIYDDNGNVYGFKISTEKYPFLYTKNQQGDITSIVNSSTGETIVNYYYDAWGRVKLGYTSTNESAKEFANEIAAYNDFAYRGYSYDIETGLYYLKSRYYSPDWCRFISPDKYCSTDFSPLGFNMYLYCKNNPVNNIDTFGNDDSSWFKSFFGSLEYMNDDPDSLESKGFFGFVNTGDNILDWFVKPWSTVVNGWQSYFGYADYYDYLAPLAGCHIHYMKSEFSYPEKDIQGNLGNEYDWRVELWMGRYGISLGAEIGIYKGHQFLDYELPIDFWYACSTEDRYPMAFILCRTEKSSDGTTFAKPFLMRITKSHWWLTGFIFNVNIFDIADNLEFNMNNQELDYSSLGILKPNNVYMLSFIGFGDPGMAEAFKQGINEDFSLGTYKVENSASGGNSFVFWASEELPEGMVPKISIYDLIKCIILTFD